MWIDAALNFGDSFNVFSILQVLSFSQSHTHTHTSDVRSLPPAAPAVKSFSLSQSPIFIASSSLDFFFRSGKM